MVSSAVELDPPLLHQKMTFREHASEELDADPSRSRRDMLGDDREHDSRPRRPCVQHFDSLQQLLEDAGYKETRIFTPNAQKSTASPPKLAQIEAKCSSKPRLPMKIDVTVNGAESALQMSGSSASSISTVTAHDIGQQQLDHLKTIAANSSWFSSSWKTITGRTPAGSADPQSVSLLRKQSEPTLSRTKRKEAQGWSSSLWRSQEVPITDLAQERHTSPAPVDAQDLAFESTHLAQNSPRPALRHAPSTQHLWQASMRHHRNKAQRTLPHARSFPSRPRNIEQPQPPDLAHKQSFDGARLFSRVGVAAAEKNTLEGCVFARISSANRRTSLREAFNDAQEAKRGTDGKVVESQPSSRKFDHAGRTGWNDSISSIVDLEDRRHANATVERRREQQQTPEHDVSTVINSSASSVRSEQQNSIQLFADIAAPLVSYCDAAAMRNVSCLEYGSSSGLVSPALGEVAPGPLRRMRSVDALELALTRMQATQAALMGARQQATIPESFSTESLSAEDFANARTTNFGCAIEEEESLGMRAGEAPLQRAHTPTLVLTSPTGIRSPQPLVLDGVEFEPRSVSPKAPSSRFVRPVAKRIGWKPTQRKNVASDGSDEFSTDAPSTCERGRPERSKALSDRAARTRRKSKISKPTTRRPTDSDSDSLQMPTARKQGTTKSCGNLRQAASKQVALHEEDHSVRTSVGRLSGSEQIRALHRSVRDRDRTTSTGSQYGSLPHKMPRSPTEHDEDDPFNDFVALSTSGAKEPEIRASRARGTSIDRSKMSPVPFERSVSHLPLRSSLAAANQSKISDLGSNARSTPHSGPYDEQKSLAQKRSGVGLACLVNLDQDAAAAANRSDVRPKLRQSTLLSRLRKQPNTATAQARPGSSPAASHSHRFSASAQSSDQAITMSEPSVYKDENANPLLESPTAHAGHRVLKKRSGHFNVIVRG